jgi:hypothetical protein
MKAASRSGRKQYFKDLGSSLMEFIGILFGGK